MIWCNTHQRPHGLCKIGRAGIAMPCLPVDVTGQLAIDFHDVTKETTLCEQDECNWPECRCQILDLSLCERAPEHSSGSPATSLPKDQE